MGPSTPTTIYKCLSLTFLPLSYAGTPKTRRTIDLHLFSGILVIRSNIMGLLEKLWDDTLAGPQPETGLGRLRKHASFSPRSGSAKEVVGGRISSAISDNLTVEIPRVTRSIMIKRPVGCPSPGTGTPPASPAGSTPPISPFSGGKEWNRIRRKSSSDACEGAGGGRLAKSPSSSSYEV